MTTINNRTEIIDSFIVLSIKEKRFDLALNAARLGATKKIIDRLVKACVENKLFKLGQKAAGLGASQKVIEFLLESIISNRDSKELWYKEEWYGLAFYTAKLGVSRKIIDSLTKICIEEKKHFTLIDLCKEFGISEELANFFVDNPPGEEEWEWPSRYLFGEYNGYPRISLRRHPSSGEIENSRRIIKKFCKNKKD